MKIFITGATGFIGTHLLERMSETDHELYCFARKTSQTQGLQTTRARIITGDINDKDHWLRVCKVVIGLYIWPAVSSSGCLMSESTMMST